MSDSSTDDDIHTDSKSAARHLKPIDEVIVDVAAKLKAIRDRLDIHCADLHFYTRVLGGKWTAEHHGKVADGIAALPRGELGQLFCNTFKYPKNRSYRFKKYGEDAAVKLATYFCQRGSHFLEIWAESDWPEVPFNFLPEHVDAFDDRLFKDWLACMHATSNAFVAGNALLHIVPEGLHGWDAPIDDSDIGSDSDEEL